MKLIETASYEKLSRSAANLISAQVILKPDSVLGLATGSSPLGTYRQLITWYEKGDVDFDKVISVNLDEYVGLSPKDAQSYRRFMNENFFDHINIRPENTFVRKTLMPPARRMTRTSRRSAASICSCAASDWTGISALTSRTMCLSRTPMW